MIVHPKRGASAPALAVIYVFLHLLDRSCFFMSMSTYGMSRA